jgi:V/A-type H+-transporting ATPase subunit E
MKGLETGKDKIQRICDILKKETLDPAKQEAREIIENAHLQAAEIVKEAKRQAEATLQGAEREMEERKKVFQASLQLACRQGVELLKQRIERELFDPQLSEVIGKEMADPKTIAWLIQSLVQWLETRGIDEELVAWIPKEISPRTINALLGAQILEKLKGKSVVLGDFAGGVQISLKERQMTLDISDGALRELVAQFIRRDFRDMLFIGPHF